VIERTQRYEIAAAHVLSHPSLTDAENRAVYGKCANPGGHGHNYGIEITVGGAVDARTGQLMAAGLLDRIFDERIRQRFANQLLNDDHAFGELVPTAENIAIVLHADLASEIASRSNARLVRVCVVETRRNSSSIGAPE
jgi:6-pyruvoyltetrahydropterin/6-carboxytetrahydropterin synthase